MVMERFAPPDAGSVDTRGDGVSSGVFYAFPHPSRRCRATFPKGILIRHGVAVPPSPKGKVLEILQPQPPRAGVIGHGLLYKILG